MDKEDRWIWNLKNSNVFSVRSVYNYLTAQPIVDVPVDAKLFWHKDIPLKVVIFAWRLLRNRLPTKDNLIRRGVINNDSIMCGSSETFNHVFLHCCIFGSV